MKHKAGIHQQDGTKGWSTKRMPKASVDIREKPSTTIEQDSP